MLQELFNKSAIALLEQGKKSLDLNIHIDTGNQCAYRNPNGLKCALGHLISEDEYSPEMEGKSIYDSIFDSWLRYKKINNEKDLNFLDELQAIHDDFDPTEWKKLLIGLGLKYNLSVEKII